MTKKKWIFINLLLLFIACLFGWKLRVSVREFKAENDLAKVQPVRDMKQQLVQESTLPGMALPQSYYPTEFAIIPEKNIFSESRSKEAETEDTAASDLPMLLQKPILVGIHITGNQSLASIIDPQSSPQNRSRRAQIKRVGDVYQGFTITEITPDSIVLESGIRKEVIPLHEGSKGVQAGKTPILSTRVVSLGGGPVSGGIPVTVIAGSTRSVQTPAAPQTIPVATPGSRQQRSPSSSTTVGVVQTPATGQQPVQQERQPRVLLPNREIDSQGRLVIRTPFGTIVRPAER